MTRFFRFSAIALACLAVGCSEDQGLAGGDAQNVAPVARLSLPTSALVGDVILFNAGESGDEDGFIVDYLFDPGDGTALLQATSGELLHTFATAGVFTVALTVVDNDGTKDTDRAQLRVTER